MHKTFLLLGLACTGLSRREQLCSDPGSKTDGCESLAVLLQTLNLAAGFAPSGLRVRSAVDISSHPLSPMMGHAQALADAASMHSLPQEPEMKKRFASLIERALVRRGHAAGTPSPVKSVGSTGSEARLPPDPAFQEVTATRKIFLWETAAMPTYEYRDGDYQDLMDSMTTVREQNSHILTLLDQLRTHDFFAFFSADLMAACSHMPSEEVPCGMEECSVEPGEDVPEEIVRRDRSDYDFVIDGWTRKDMPSDYSEYYDLRAEPERNTGYNGTMVWRFIHQKICFEGELMEAESAWKRDFNRFVSGMHAAVHAQILADIGFTDEGRAEYRRRLRDEPGAIANLYFAYMLTLCAIRECKELLDNCGYLGQGEAIRPTMQALTGSALLASECVQRAAQNLREHAQSPKTERWQARLRMRGLYRVMSCVQCSLCRLHGKVMTIGLGATLQVLLGTDGNGGDPRALSRVEYANLVTTAAKFGSACATVERFREFDGEDMSKAFGVA